MRDALYATTPTRPLTERDVAAIDAIDDAALRNLWITQSYADLARRLLDLLGTDQTWCTFAIWASNTAGLSIRGEELPRLVDELLLADDDGVDKLARKGGGVVAAIQRTVVDRLIERSHVERLVATAVAQVASSVAEGNTLVHRELAPLFVRFVERLERGHAFGPATIDVELDALGVPPGVLQPLVRRAFQQYALATTVAGPARAQHVLAANIAAVLHEQQRLQPFITAALDAGVVDAGHDLYGVLPAGDPLLSAHALTAMRSYVAAHLERLWRQVATKLMMTLVLPGETLHLGRDVPPPPGRPLFPDDLVVPTLPVLIDLLEEWDTTLGTGHGSGVRDWADLRQRMGYIVTLFRSRQQYLALTAPPFDAAEQRAMADGDVPSTL